MSSFRFFFIMFLIPKKKIVFKTKIYNFIIFQLSNISICLLMNHSTLSLTLSFFLLSSAVSFTSLSPVALLCVWLSDDHTGECCTQPLSSFPWQHFYLAPLTAVVWLRALLRFFSPLPRAFFSLSLCLPPFILKNLVNLSYFVIIITITEH